jgi:hypothetical protein
MDAPQLRTFWATAIPTLLWAGWLIGWDLWTYSRHGNTSTISVVFGILFRQWPVLTWMWGLATGVLAGHILWGQDRREIARGFLDAAPDDRETPDA